MKYLSKTTVHVQKDGDFSSSSLESALSGVNSPCCGSRIQQVFIGFILNSLCVSKEPATSRPRLWGPVNIYFPVR
ncbi:hypothetical protein R1flu_019711 [Riccia fluitans]|uniref:Uncharacterized protein n=1 Tax=Riccia fluitans TaxID=41844 RepID=A0ABD1ZJF4_9MARC